MLKFFIPAVLVGATLFRSASNIAHHAYDIGWGDGFEAGHKDGHVCGLENARAMMARARQADLQRVTVMHTGN
jgi:hypothetical protein